MVVPKHDGLDLNKFGLKCSLHSEPAPVWSERPVSPCASLSTTEGHLVCINWQTTCFDQMVNDTLGMRKVGLCICKNVKSDYNLKNFSTFLIRILWVYHSSILAAYNSLVQTQRGQLKFWRWEQLWLWWLCASDFGIHSTSADSNQNHYPRVESPWSDNEWWASRVSLCPAGWAHT